MVNVEKQTPTSLENRLATLTLTDLPHIPPHFTYDVDGAQKPNIHARPDQQSLNNIIPLVPQVSSVIYSGFQKVGFAIQLAETGFEATLLGRSGTSAYYGIIWEGSRLKAKRFDVAFEDLAQTQEKHCPITGHINQLINRVGIRSGSNVILLRHTDHPQYVQLLVKQFENVDSYPYPASPYGRLGSPDPMLITFKTPEAATTFTNLLKQNPLKNLHTLIAILLTPGILLSLQDAHIQDPPLIVKDGLPTDPDHYKDDISGIISVPGGITLQPLAEV